jgi:quercetin dioxygenase-like cupin family protein
MRKLLFISFCAVSAFAQSTTVVDNDQVKVLKVTQSPHKKTSLHEHSVNRVMIYLQPGKQTFEYPDGKKSVLTWTAGEAKWSPAGGKHIAEITSDNPVTIVEVELKKPGNPAKAAKPALDPVKIDPKHYKVEFENDQVRVIRAKIGPKEIAPMHEHALNRIVTYITDQDFRVTGADGKVETPKHKAGDVSFSPPNKHKEENLTDKPFEVLVVELKY